MDSLDTIVTNFTIRIFLETTEKRYIVGPKGSGKTLLLLRKAIDQRKKGGVICIPSDPNLPVDRLTATEHIGKRFNYKISDKSESSLAWAAVWKHSIFRSVLHHLRDQILAEHNLDSAVSFRKGWEDELDLARLKASRDLVDYLITGMSSTPQRPFYYLTEIGAKLDSSPRTTLKKVREENRQMETLLQEIRRDVYVFLDNLDDYYEKEPFLWFNSMYGQFRAVREIGLTHRGIHLFTTIRKDVYNQFSDEMRLQYYDYIAPLEYTKDELLKIFEVHIRELDPALLCTPALQKTDPWRAFFGDCVAIPNEFVGREEDIRDYIHRHTLGRPRDMIHMGTRLLQKRPTNGFDPDSVWNAVIGAEEDIAEQYIAEIKPLLDQRFNIKDLIRNHVPCNILTPDQIEECTEDFILSYLDYLYDPDAPSDITRPFATLYELGLLGFAQRKAGSKKFYQTFLPPGHGLSSPEERLLPESSLYFLHPILNHLLPGDRKSSEMVVGQNLSVACEETNHHVKN